MGHGIAACGARSALELPDPIDSTKTCGQFSAAADLAKLDVFMLIDSSGSMEAQTALGNTKWEAVKGAIGEFIDDPTTDGMNVGITFMPQIDESVRALCRSDEQCDQVGACMPLGLCLPSESSICQTDGQCLAAGDHCERLGLCEGGEGVFCNQEQGACGALGECLPAGFCENRNSCDAASYNIIGLASLPEQAPGLLAALDARERDGFTPTLPALTGATESAVAHAAANPRNKVVVLVATDGLPTTCDDDLPVGGVPAGIANLTLVAQVAEDDAVQTFVIGVFAPDEAEFAAGNLNAIARAGGTGEAFIVTTDSEVASLVRDALEQVRRSNACEFGLSDEARQLDLTQIRVQLGGTTNPLGWIDWVGEASDCGNGQGFFFDRDPTGTTSPGRVILCPASCATEPQSIVVSCKDAIDYNLPEP